MGEDGRGGGSLQCGWKGQERKLKRKKKKKAGQASFPPLDAHLCFDFQMPTGGEK